jgi:hypothetical protein
MKDPVDIRKVEAKIDEAARMRADMMKKGLAHRLEVRALLTAEQKAKLGEMGCGMGGAMMGVHRGRMMGGRHMAGKECTMRHGRAKTGCEAKAECLKKAEEK